MCTQILTLAVLFCSALIVSCQDPATNNASLTILGPGVVWKKVKDSIVITCMYKSAQSLAGDTVHPEFIKDGLPINVDTNFSLKKISPSLNELGSVLTIEDMSPADAGTYKCQKGNKSYSKQVNMLQVDTPMEVYNKTKNVIECKPSFHPQTSTNNYKVEWTKNNKDLDATRVTINGTIITINNPEWTDIGDYVCTFEIQTGETEYFLAFNASLYGAPMVDAKTLGKSRNLVQGDKLELNCPASGHPSPTIQWYKDDAPIKTGQERVTISDYENLKDGKLLIYDLQFEDKGNYKCLANSTMFNSSEAEIVIRVKDRLAALWPFLGIVAEVIVLCIIIFIYEKKRSKEMEDEADGPTESVGNAQDHKGKDEVRQRNVRT